MGELEEGKHENIQIENETYYYYTQKNFYLFFQLDPEKYSL